MTRAATLLGQITCGAAVLGLLLGAPARVEADVLSCPDSLGPGITRQVSITWDNATNPGGVGECEDYGTGNIGPGGFENVSLTYDGEIFPWIEKDDSGQANNGGTLNIDIGPQSGAFSFTTPGDYLLGLKFGGGPPGEEPDWVIVQLTNVNSGTFAWNGFATGLSHALVWGTPGTSVPEPASLLLLGGGFAAAALTLRRRRKTA